MIIFKKAIIASMAALLILLSAGCAVVNQEAKETGQPASGPTASSEGAGVADIAYSDLDLPKAPGIPEPDAWGGMKAVKAGNVFRMTSRQNYNEAFFALGKKAVVEQLVNDIAHRKGG